MDTKEILEYDFRGGRYLDFTLKFQEEEIKFVSTSHGNIQFEFNQVTLIQHGSEEKNFTEYWLEVVNFIQKILQSANLPPTFDSWKKLTRALNFTEYTWIFFKDDLSSMVDKWNTFYISEWVRTLEQSNP